MHTIAELPEYLRRAKHLLSEVERKEIIDFLALNPQAGVLIKSSGGVRKLRWGRGDKGKSGGVRIIYFYYDESIPLYLLTLFGKGEKENLSKSERNKLGKLVRLIVASWRKRHG